jgi:hypothetical protein
MFYMRFSLFFAIALLSSTPAQSAVWETLESWSPSWEARYEAWVKKEWRVDIFRNPKSPYKGPYPDCADTVYSMRAIFASQNGLPFAVVDPSNSRSAISNNISKFDHIEPGPKRLNAFLVWLYDILGTASLPADTYPVAITRQTVKAGGLLLAKESKHSYTIKEIKETGVPTLYYSTQGNTGDLKVRAWPSTSYLFAAGIKEPSGIRFFRYPEDLRKAVWQVPGYSQEQYQVSAEKWTATMQKKLALKEETSEQALRRLMADVCQLVTTRVDLVYEAEKKQAQINHACMNAKDYDDLSTPSRDGQIKAALHDLQEMYQSLAANESSLPEQLREELANIFAASASQERGAQYCAIKYRETPLLSLGEFRRSLLNGLVSHNPNDPAAKRWGDSAVSSDHAKNCPTY